MAGSQSLIGLERRLDRWFVPWVDRRDGEVRKVLYTPEEFANLAEGFCPFARIHASQGETAEERDARLVLTEDGWLRCSTGGEYRPVRLDQEATHA